MQIIDRIGQIHDDLTKWRRDIHAHPELGFEEQRTSDLVAAKLAEFGCEVHRGVGKTGVVGRLRVGNSPRSVGLRADMDALPMDEETNLPWRSTIPNRFHGCGSRHLKRRNPFGAPHPMIRNASCLVHLVTQLRIHS